MSDNRLSKMDDRNGFFGKHPVILTVLVICAIAVLGVIICYLSIAIFTKHGETDRVPSVENMSYTQAVSLLQEEGFRVDIRDSIFSDEVRPGYVIEQFPKAGSIVKPGRKIFLYINAVHPKEVIMDDDNHPEMDALRGYPERQGISKLKELGFKNIRVVYVLGDNDCIVKVTANGRTVKKMQKVPVNASLVVEISDNRMGDLLDSLQNEEVNQDLERMRSFSGGYEVTVEDDEPGQQNNAPHEPENSEDPEMSGSSYFL